MTSEQALAPSPTVACFSAEKLRAALAVATFASVAAHDPDVLRLVRVTVEETGRTWTQATDRYIAVLFVHLAPPPTQPLDVVLKRADALALAKALRTAVGDVTVEAMPHGGATWLVRHENRKGVKTEQLIPWVPVGGAVTWPKLTPLLAPSGHPRTGTTVDPARLVALAEWQKLAGGDYAPPNGVALVPAASERQEHPQARAVMRPRHDGEGLVALLMGTRIAEFDGDIAEQADKHATALLDGAPL